MLVPHYIYHCSFVVSFEIVRYESCNMFFFKILLAAWDSLELSDQLFHLYKKGHWASVFNRFNNLLHSLASRVLKAFLRAYVEILVLVEPFTKQPVLIVDNNFKTDQVAFFRSGIWVLLKTVGRVHSMMWSKPYFQIHYALSIYFKILLLTDNYKRCRWWGAWRLCISVFIFEVRKLNSKIMGSKYLVTDMLYITGHWYSVNVHFEIGFSGSS